MELKDLLEFTGIEAESMDDFKQKFEGEFIRKSNATSDKEIVSAVTGKVLGSITTKTKQLAKEYGIELSGEEIKDKNVEEVFNLTLEKFNGIAEEKLTLAKASGVSDEAVKAWEDKFTKKNSEAIQYKQQLEKLSGDFVSFKEQAETQVKTVVTGSKLTDVKKQVKISPTATDLEKLGFETTIEKNYKFDLNDAGDLIVTDKEGKFIPSPKVAGTFKTPLEVLQEEADKNGLSPKNPHTNPVNNPFVHSQSQNEKSAVKGRTLHPAAQR